MITISTKIDDIHSLINAVTHVNQVFGGQIWWRGNPDTSFHLQPSVFRPREGNGGYEYENNINIRFIQKAPALRINTPSQNEYFEWLFLMQHYGLPTRLLDWTESPLIACYFAVTSESEKTEEVDGALFALSPYNLNYYQTEISGLLTPQAPQALEIAKRAFGSKNPCRSNVLAILPNLIDARMIAQLSTFTIHDDKNPLEDNEKSDAYLIKYEISAKSKILLKEQLKHAGIRPSSIFPDLEHLAKEIKDIRKFNYPSEIKLANPDQI